jgi:hypothetical protein
MAASSSTQERRAFHETRCSIEKKLSFCRQRRGGENWACLASLIETCKLNGVNPQVYFTISSHTPGERLAAEAHR